MAALAAGFVNSTDRHVFLTGKAGTGKTTLLRRVVAGTHKRCVIVAPTGIAALNAGGVTIHSQFLLPFGTFVPERRLPAELVGTGRFHDRYTLDGRHPLNAVRRQVLRDLESLMNAVALESTQDLSSFPQVRRSVLNFGCPDISNRTIDEARLAEIREEI